MSNVDPHNLKSAQRGNWSWLGCVLATANKRENGTEGGLEADCMRSTGM